MKNVKVKIQIIMTLLVVFYGCESWSLTSRKKYSESVSEQGTEENIWNQEE
jgi:hypothetical protein